jgi:glycosyltransferase involved in cell wall biosynthesis
LVRVEVLRQRGFLHSGFVDLDAAALEWGHRCIRRGVILRHLPALIFALVPQLAPCLSLVDELRFMRLRYGVKWQLWASFRMLLSDEVSLLDLLRANRTLSSENSPLESAPFQKDSDSSAENLDKHGRVSVLIPTIERYQYLKVLLSQLREQTYPAYEIIIVDQTPVPAQDKALYAAFTDLPMKVIFLEQAGQCASRNAGLQAACGEYVLFIDDDDEIRQDLIETHLRHLWRCRGEVSSGVAHEVGAGLLPADFTYARVSDVFPTNNSLIRRSILERSGLFDLAFDHGARADADLGMRLYFSGALMLLNPAIDVLHHHAPRGGLRTHKARVITYASSRASLVQRHLPSATEIYLSQRYFSPRQVRETFWLAVFSSFVLTGPLWRRILKALICFLLLPDTILRLWQKNRQAEQLGRLHPTIPNLPKKG